MAFYYGNCNVAQYYSRTNVCGALDVRGLSRRKICRSRCLCGASEARLRGWRARQIGKRNPLSSPGWLAHHGIRRAWGRTGCEMDVPHSMSAFGGHADIVQSIDPFDMNEA